MIILVVNSRSQAVFTLARDVLAARSRYFDRTIRHFASHPNANGEEASFSIELPTIRLCDFFNFVRRLETGRIVYYQSHGAPRAVQDAGHRLVNALCFGIKSESGRYQVYAMRGLFNIGHMLPAPEKLVERIFNATEGDSLHPARKLIVALVAYGIGGQALCLPVSDRERKSVPRMEAITSDDFWELYDEYCKSHAFRHQYPASVDEAIKQW